MLNRIVINFYSLLIFLIGLSYFQFYHLEFAQPDDKWMLISNKDVWGYTLSCEYLINIFTNPYCGQYSPVNTLYYFGVHSLFGLSPKAYHIGSILLHLINSILIFIMMKKVLGEFKVENFHFLAKVITLLWAVHPMNIETVVWISASKILFYVLFFALSFLSYSYYLSNRKIYYLIFSIILYVLSCCSKEQACFGFLVFIAYYLCLYMRKYDFKRDFAVYVFFFILSVISVLQMAYTKTLNENEVFIKPVLDYTLKERLYLIFTCVNFYFKNAVLPFGLHYHYPYSFKSGQFAPILAIIFPFIFIGLVYLYCSYIRKVVNYAHLYIFLALSFCSQIFIALQIIPLGRPSIVADRYMYLPLIFFIAHIIVFSHQHLKKVYFNALIAIFILYFIFYNQQLLYKWREINLILKFIPA